MFNIFKRKRKKSILLKGPINKSSISKSIEMKDAKIKYLSLVDKPANGVKFLVKKNKDNKPEFEISAEIVKSSKMLHEITGVVYEPLIEDCHGNFMTADEIKKAANWFEENGEGADIQHNEKLAEGVKIVKSWVLDDDEEINGKVYKAGTWMAKAKITNSEIWEKIEKKEITGWSMGGDGTYVMNDVNIDNLKTEVEDSIVKRIAKAFGFGEENKIEKGAFKDKFTQTSKVRNFWCAFDVLQSVLYPWDTNILESDPKVIKEALSEFSGIMKEILTSDDGEIAKAFELKEGIIFKAVKKISKNNEEDSEMKHEEIATIVKEVVKSLNNEENKDKDTISKSKNSQVDNEKSLTQSEMISTAVFKAMEPVLKSLGVEPEVELTQEEKIAKEVSTQIQKALEPIYKARGLSKSLDSEEQEENQTIEKSYMRKFTGQ